MFSGLRRLLGMVSVEESGDQIKVSGLPGDSVAKTIAQVWGTQKIATIMFSRVSPSAIAFNRFFAPDVVYAFNRIIGEKRRGHNIRALRKVVAGIYEATWMKDTLVKHPDILDPAQLNQLKWDPLEHQAGFFRWFNEMVPRFHLHGALLGAGPGTGKAQPLHAHIKTPGGWSTMAEMKVGTKVVTARGTVTTVTGVYPQGIKDIYRITFADGRQAECCGDHLWKVHLRHERKSGYWHVRTTREVMTSTSFAAGRAYIPLIAAEDRPPADLPIDPYLLGVILGDGCICTGNAVVISNPDPFIREKIRDRLGPRMCIGNLAAKNEYNLVGIPTPGRPRFNPLVAQLDEFGLMNRHSHTKTIPQIYLVGSRQQRLDLLNGLLDTDGTADKSGSASFLSTSPDLAEGVQYLVRSLGGMASLSVKRKTFTYLGEKKQGRVAYQINIRHPCPEELFSLPRKKARLNNGNQYAATLKLGVDRIDLIGSMPAQCISIADDDGLYVTDGFVVTHNTFMGLALGLQLHADVVIVVCPGRAVKKVWEDTIVTQFRRPQPYWHSQMGTAPAPRMRYYIVHYDAQEKFLAFARTQHWHKPVILLDESHGMNEIEALRTQLFIALCDLTKSQYILWESGTPVKALGGEMAPLFRTIDPLFDPDAQQRFSAIYGRASQRANDILAHRLGKVTYKVESGSVVKVELHHIPKKVRIPNGVRYTLTAIREEMRRFIEARAKHYLSNMRQYERMFENALNAFEKTLVTPEQKNGFRQYERAVKLIRKDFDPVKLKDEIRLATAYEKKVILPALPKTFRQDFKDAKSVVKYYKLKVQGEALGQILGRRRGQCIIDMVPHMGLEDIIDTALKKTLMFTSYVGVVDAAADFLKQRGYRPLRVYGETNNELAGMVNEFGRDEDANPMIATYQSLSSAVPLVMANTMVMANAPFRSFEYDQAVARCKRLGQDENVYVNDVMLDTGAESNISSRTIDIMQWSRAQVDELLGFENEQLIATESLHERNGRAVRALALEALAQEEFEQAMAPWTGRSATDIYGSVLPGWAQWASA